MNPQLLRTNFGDFFSTTALPVLEEIFYHNLKISPSLRSVLAKVENTQKDIWQYTQVHDTPAFTSVAEGADYIFDTMVQGYDKTLTVVKYGRGFSISEEAIDDGKFNFVADAVAKMAKSAKESQESSFIGMFNNGFTTETCADGVALFSVSHTTPTGTFTIANKPATDVDLSVDSLSTAYAAFSNAFRGDSGIYYPISPKFLLVPPGLQLYAQQLVGSSGIADSANNNINPLQNKLQVVVSPHLSDADAWFLLADPVDNQGALRIIVRRPIETMASPALGWVNDSILYKARYREILGAMHPHGVYGTSGG